MKILESHQNDPAFAQLLSAILDSVVRKHAPEMVVIIRVNNWFDHKWLEWGAFAAWKDSMTIPPFHPNRIEAQTVYRLSPSKQYHQVEVPPIHPRRISTENINRKLARLTDSGIFVWWSGNTNANGRGSVMVYTQKGSAATAWYASFHRDDGWIINKTKGISVEAVHDFIKPVEPDSGANAASLRRSL